MSNLTFSVPEEIKVRITAVPRYSALITRLIRDYLEQEQNADILKIRREELINSLNSKVKIINHQIEIKEKEAMTVQETKEEKEKHEKEIIENIKDSAKTIFNVELSDDEVKEYRGGDWETLREYINR